MTRLFDRLLIAKQRLPAFPSALVIIFEDPGRASEQPASVLIPDPNCMAALMHGGVLPEVEAFHQTEYTVTEGSGVEYKGMGFHEFDDYIIDLVERGGSLKSQVVTKYTVHDAPVMGPVDEREALRWFMMKDMAKRVWGDSSSNFPRYQVVKHNVIPTIRAGRNHWSMTGDENAPVKVEMVGARTELKGKLINRFVRMQGEIEAKRPFAQYHEPTHDEIKDFDKIDMDVILANVVRAQDAYQLESAIPALLQ